MQDSKVVKVPIAVGVKYGRNSEAILSNTLIYVNVSSPNHLATVRISTLASLENPGAFWL